MKKSLWEKYFREKYGVPEITFLFIYTKGYNSAFNSNLRNPYSRTKNPTAFKIWAKGKREAKLINNWQMGR